MTALSRGQRLRQTLMGEDFARRYDLEHAAFGERQPKRREVLQAPLVVPQVGKPWNSSRGEISPRRSLIARS